MGEELRGYTLVLTTGFPLETRHTPLSCIKSFASFLSRSYAMLEALWGAKERRPLMSLATMFPSLTQLAG